MISRWTGTLLSVFFLTFTPQLSIGQSLDHLPLRAWEYQLLDRSYVEAGLVPPFSSRPFTNRRLDTYAEEISRRRLSLPTTRALAAMRAEVGATLQDTLIRPVVITNLSAQVRSEWLRNRDQYLHYRDSIKRAPLLDLGFVAAVPYAVAHLEWDIRRDFFSGYETDGFTNLPIGGQGLFQELDYNFPTRGYLVVGTPTLDLTIGRDTLKWGPGHRGSLILSDSPPYYDMVNLVLTLPQFRASLFFAVLESYLTTDEIQQQLDMKDAGAINFPKDNTEQRKSLVGHRFEFRLGDYAVLGATETLVIGGRSPEFSELTPMMFLHNVYGENYGNDFIAFDVSTVFMRGLQLYGEFGIEDVRNAEEGTDSPPTSLAYLAGAYYTRGLSVGNLDLRLEWAYVDPWTYNRWQPLMLFTARKKFLSVATDENTTLDFPTGYFLGPDVQSVYLYAGWSQDRAFRVGADYELRLKGRVYLDPLDPESQLANYPNRGGPAPTGPVEISHIVGIEGTWEPLPRWTLSARLVGGHRTNAEHVDGRERFFGEVYIDGTFKPLQPYRIWE